MVPSVTLPSALPNSLIVIEFVQTKFYPPNGRSLHLNQFVRGNAEFLPDQFLTLLEPILELLVFSQFVTANLDARWELQTAGHIRSY